MQSFSHPLFILILLLLLGIHSALANNNPQAHIGFYIKKYGRADPQNSLHQRTYAIFQQVQAVADKRLQRLPQLAIVNSQHNWAKALSDGYIVLSSQAVKLSYQQVEASLGDARMAFILGHELAHLANDDFFANPHKGVSAKEFAADTHGFIYAAMAGYAVQQLLQNNQQQQDFFSLWQAHYAQSGQSINFDSHPAPAQRVAALQAKLNNIMEQLAFFKFGVRLSHFDRCEDANYFFKQFQSHFPAREVLNNLGYCALRQAQKAMGQAAHRYCMPTLLEMVSQADILVAPAETLRSWDGGDVLGFASPRHYLQQAITFFSEASAADPTYAPAFINLAVSYFYQNEIYPARAAIEKARRLTPENIDVLGLRELIIYAEGQDVDVWSEVIHDLQKLSKREENSVCVRYNTAQLLTERGRAGAQTLWQQLADQANQLPASLRQMVCQQATCAILQMAPAPRNWQLPIKLGSYIKRDPASRAALKTWQKQTFDWQTEIYGTLYQSKDGAMALLELTGYAEMLVLKQPKVAMTELSAYCATPLRSKVFAQGRVLSCQDWAAWVINRQIREVWLISH